MHISTAAILDPMRFIIILAAVFLLLLSIVRADRSIEVSVDLSQQDKNISYIIIKPAPGYNILLDTNISIPITIYRGKTLKRTVYVWVQDSNGKRISSRQKFSLPTRFTSYNLKANLSFSACRPSGSYIIIAEGLDTDHSEQLALQFSCSSSTPAPPKAQDGKISFSVINTPTRIESGIPFKTRLLITNPTDQYLEVDAWSYVYRSSRSYSGEREQNKKTINLPEHSNVTFDLGNTVHAQPGEYSLKIKFLRSDRKTPKELTFPITVDSNSSKTDTLSAKSNKLTAANADDNTQTPPATGKDSNSSTAKRKLFSSTPKNSSGQTVFKSSSAKAKGLAVYFLIAVLALILIALIIKKL
jgi:hypothetical protein